MTIGIILYIIAIIGIAVGLNISYWEGIREKRIGIFLSGLILVAGCTILAHQSLNMIGK